MYNKTRRRQLVSTHTHQKIQVNMLVGIFTLLYSVYWFYFIVYRAYVNILQQ